MEPIWSLPSGTALRPGVLIWSAWAFSLSMAERSCYPHDARTWLTKRFATGDSSCRLPHAR